MIGNQVEISVDNGDKVYKYNPTIPFHIAFWTTRGNYFSTEFYTGLYLPWVIYFDEEYKGLNFSIQYGKEDWKYVIFDFIGEHSVIVLVIEITFVVIVFRNLKRKRKKSKIQENNVDE